METYPFPALLVLLFLFLLLPGFLVSSSPLFLTQVFQVLVCELFAILLVRFVAFSLELDLRHFSAALADARELESYRHSHLHLGFLEDCRVIVSHDTVVHQVFD